MESKMGVRFHGLVVMSVFISSKLRSPHNLTYIPTPFFFIDPCLIRFQPYIFRCNALFLVVATLGEGAGRANPHLKDGYPQFSSSG